MSPRFSSLLTPGARWKLDVPASRRTPIAHAEVLTVGQQVSQGRLGLVRTKTTLDTGRIKRQDVFVDAPAQLNQPLRAVDALIAGSRFQASPNDTPTNTYCVIREPRKQTGRSLKGFYAVSSKQDPSDDQAVARYLKTGQIATQTESCTLTLLSQ